MRTYAETSNVAPFDWNAFLAQETFDPDELTNAMGLSNKWVTCACGNLCDALPRNYIGEPLDHDLFELGLDFHNAIMSMEATHSLGDFEKTIEWRDEARKILAQIEARSIKLLTPLVP